MSRLTLSVNPVVIAQAKRHAKRQGVSLSKMVEDYLAAVATAQGDAPARTFPPVLQLLWGTLKKANPEDHRKYLAAKYR